MVVYTGVSGAVRTVGSIRTGVGGVARTVGNGHIGVAGVKRPFMQFKLTDVSYFYFGHRYVKIESLEYDSSTNLTTHRHLGYAYPTSSGYLLSDINAAIANDGDVYVKSPDGWAIGLGTNAYNEWLLKGSTYGTTSTLANNIAITCKNQLSPFLQLVGNLYVVLNDGTNMVCTDFFNNSNVASASVMIRCWCGGAGTYRSSIYLPYFFNHTFFSENGVPWNGGYETHTYSLDDFKNSNNSWSISIGSIYGYVTVGFVVNSVGGNDFIWKFTDTDGNTVTFDKSKVKCTVWT